MPIFGIEIPANVTQFNVLVRSGAAGRPPTVYTGTPETTEAALTSALSKNPVFRGYCKENGLYDSVKKAAVLHLQFEFYDASDAFIGKTITPTQIVIPFRRPKKKVGGMDEASAMMISNVAVAQKQSQDSQHANTLSVVQAMLDNQNKFLEKASDILNQVGLKVDNVTTIAVTAIDRIADAAKRAEMREENRTDLLLLDLKDRHDKVKDAMDKLNPVFQQAAASATPQQRSEIDSILGGLDKALSIGMKWQQLTAADDKKSSDPEKK